MLIRTVGQDVYKITTAIDEVAFVTCNKDNGYSIVDSLPYSVSGKYLLVDGVIVVDEEAERKATIPQALTPLQARRQLTKEGLRDTVEELVATNTEYKDFWEYAQVIKRDDPTLNKLAEVIGLTQDELDNLFIEASKL